jgi:hypothetical protein
MPKKKATTPGMDWNGGLVEYQVMNWNVVKRK